MRKRSDVTICNGFRVLKTLKTIPLGPLVILIIAALSCVAIAVWPSEKSEGLVFWTFAQHHARMYGPVIDDWNEQAEQNNAEQIQMFVLSMGALNRRTQSGMWADTATSDLVEIEQPSVARFMAGPIEEVGFHDLTVRLKSEGIYDQLNEPSFAPWSSRGRIFGLPHDVHPVLLCYRADLVEEAGIDVSQIKTWGDFERAMKPLVSDLDGDGDTDRYALGLWYTSQRDVETLLLQAGGGTFNEQGQSIIASDANAQVLSRMVTWCDGPNRIAIDAPEFSPSGNELKLKGRVVAALMPDWLAGVWMNDMAALSGKLKLMPLPAWEEGGRRTSVMGGTMIAIPKTTRDFESAWAFAKELYLSPELAQKLFESNHIISPLVDLWNEPYYAVKEPYFSDQQSGLIYIEQAPNVPYRTSSPFHQVAMQQIMDACAALRNYAETHDRYQVDALIPEAKRLLEIAEKRIEQEMSRNVFIAGQAGEPSDE